MPYKQDTPSIPQNSTQNCISSSWSPFACLGLVLLSLQLASEARTSAKYCTLTIVSLGVLNSWLSLGIAAPAALSHQPTVPLCVTCPVDLLGVQASMVAIQITPEHSFELCREATSAYSAWVSITRAIQPGKLAQVLHERVQNGHLPFSGFHQALPSLVPKKSLSDSRRKQFSLLLQKLFAAFDPQDKKSVPYKVCTLGPCVNLLSAWASQCLARALLLTQTRVKRERPCGILPSTHLCPAFPLHMYSCRSFTLDS